MSDRSGIFAGDDPFDLARRWLAEASESELNDPQAAALSTVDENGMPNVRIVLVREIEDNGFVFYTNFLSVKGMELASAPNAALVFHWKSLRRQIRVRGAVEKVSDAMADGYYNGRALGSRLGAWASKQSQPLENRAELEQAQEQAQRDHGEDPARPPYWGGFRVIPAEIEFWADGPFRLHDRFRWTRKKGETHWEISRLNP